MRIDPEKFELAMAKACISSRKLREASGVSDVTLYRIRRGAQQPRPSTVGKLARALGVEVTEIIESEVG